MNKETSKQGRKISVAPSVHSAAAQSLAESSLSFEEYKESLPLYFTKTQLRKYRKWRDADFLRYGDPDWILTSARRYMSTYYYFRDYVLSFELRGDFLFRSQRDVPPNERYESLSCRLYINRKELKSFGWSLSEIKQHLTPKMRRRSGYYYLLGDAIDARNAIDAEKEASARALANLIQTSTTKELAEKMGISERQAYRKTKAERSNSKDDAKQLAIQLKKDGLKVADILAELEKHGCKIDRRTFFRWTKQ